MVTIGTATNRPIAFSFAVGLLGGSALISTVSLTTRGPMIFLPYAGIVFATAAYLRHERVRPFARRFADAVKKAGIENFHWHDLRHTFASRLAMAGVPILAIQEALGHKNIAMTVRYAHLAPDFMADAVEKLVPQEPSTPTTETPIATDTRTDTEAIALIAPTSTSVH